MHSGLLRGPWVLAPIVLLLLSGECLLFHFDLLVAVHALDLLTIVLVPGFVIAELLALRFELELDGHQVLSLGAGIGFAAAALLLSLVPFHFDFICLVLPFALLWRTDFNWMMKWMGFGAVPRVPMKDALRTMLLLFIASLVYLAIYNLQGFHFTSDGGIVTRGLFGVDIPFLAGEVHGLREFGTLRDLHQSAQPWQYHDAIYKILAHFQARTTISDLAFAAPLAGYSLLGLSVFAVVLHAAGNRVVAWFAVLAFFIASGWAGLDASSYALSPSFVFGSVLLINILLVFDIAAQKTGRARTAMLGIALLLLIALAETKLTSLLVIAGAILLLACFKLIRKDWRNAVQYAFLGITPLLVLALQSRPNPFMPAGDFLIGAPLFGYANHVAALLHLSLASVNPVTHATFAPRSLLILPYFIFHLLRFIALDPRLIAAVVVIFFLRPRSGLGTLLLLIIPIGFFLPILYSPAWYPLALSFYAPLASLQAAVLIVAMQWKSIVERKPAKIAVAILLGISVGHGLFQMAEANRSTPYVVSADFVHAMDSVRERTPQNTPIITHRYDFEEPRDESFFWYAALSGRVIKSEGAKYGTLLGAVADQDSAKGLHRVISAESSLRSSRELIASVHSDPAIAYAVARRAPEYRNYILIDHTANDSLTAGAHLDTVFSNSAVTLLR